jgi:hypothetical protein
MTTRPATHWLSCGSSSANGGEVATRITFIWEESGEMSYDELMDQLMFLGAEDIESEDFTPSMPEPQTGKRKKKPQSEGIALPTDGIT